MQLHHITALLLSFGTRQAFADTTAATTDASTTGSPSSTDDPFHFTVTGSRFPGSTDPPDNDNDDDDSDGGNSDDDSAAGIEGVNKEVAGVAAVVLGLLAI